MIDRNFCVLFSFLFLWVTQPIRVIIRNSKNKNRNNNVKAKFKTSGESIFVNNDNFSVHSVHVYSNGNCSVFDIYKNILNYKNECQTINWNLCVRQPLRTCKEAIDVNNNNAKVKNVKVINVKVNNVCKQFKNIYNNTFGDQNSACSVNINSNSQYSHDIELLKNNNSNYSNNYSNNGFVYNQKENSVYSVDTSSTKCQTCLSNDIKISTIFGNFGNEKSVYGVDISSINNNNNNNSHNYNVCNVNINKDNMQKKNILPKPMAKI